MIADQQRGAFVAVETERLVGRQVAARSDPDLQPPAAHQIEHRGVLRHPDRQLQRQADDAGPEADPCGARSGLGKKHEGRRQAAFVLVKMMLRDPGGIEAAILGVDDLREGQPVALSRVRLIEQAGEKAQAQLRPHVGHRRHPDAAAQAGQGGAGCRIGFLLDV